MHEQYDRMVVGNSLIVSGHPDTIDWEDARRNESVFCRYWFCNSRTRLKDMKSRECIYRCLSFCDSYSIPFSYYSSFKSILAN